MAGKESSKKQPQKRKRAGLFTKLILAILLVALGYQLSTLQQQVSQARQQEEALAAQVEEQKQINAAIAADIQRGQDPQLLEELARGELGMAYSGEKVFVDSSYHG